MMSWCPKKKVKDKWVKKISQVWVQTWPGPDPDPMDTVQWGPGPGPANDWTGPGPPGPGPEKMPRTSDSLIVSFVN